MLDRELTPGDVHVLVIEVAHMVQALGYAVDALAQGLGRQDVIDQLTAEFEASSARMVAR